VPARNVGGGVNEQRS